MTKEQARRLQEVAGWIADGKQIQVQYTESEVWQTPNTDAWVSFSTHCDYRLKPEPREWWLVNGVAFQSYAGAKYHAFGCTPQAKIIHVKEVL